MRRNKVKHPTSMYPREASGWCGIREEITFRLTRRYSGFLPLFLLFLFAGCGGSSKHYTLNGQLLAKDELTARITVSNENIPGFMPAMTMSYTVKDPGGLEQADPGDRITASVVVRKNSYWLEHITVTDRSKRGTLIANQPHELLPGEQVPDVPLIDQDGRTLHLADFRGKAVLVVCRKVTITSGYASKLVWPQTAKCPLPALNVPNSAASLNRVPCRPATSFAPSSS